MKYYLMCRSRSNGEVSVARVYNEVENANDDIVMQKHNNPNCDFTIIPIDDDETQIVKWDDALNLFFMYTYSSIESAKRNLETEILKEGYQSVKKEDDLYYECYYVDEDNNDFIDVYLIVE